MNTSICLPVKGEVLRYWTPTSIECYERGCICDGCFYQHFFSKDYKGNKPVCQMKRTVLALYTKFGKPNKKNTRRNQCRFQ